MDANITIVEVAQWVWDHILSILVVVGLFVEITPIKFNPITALLNLIFKPLKNDMKDLEDKLTAEITNVKTELKQDIDSLRQQQADQSTTVNNLIRSLEMEEISRVRWTIIEYSRSLDNGQLHTKDEYLHIRDLNKRYHELIEKNNLTNGLLDEEIEKIESHYQKHKDSTSVYF